MPIHNEEIADIIRSGLSAFETGKLEITEPEARVGGFGWRNYSWRDHSVITGEAMKSVAEQFLNSMEYYHIEVEELNTWSDENVGLAWGVYIEDFKPKEYPQEKVRVRFTTTLKKDSSGWHSLMFHRDAQPFNESGQYFVDLTKIK